MPFNFGEDSQTSGQPVTIHCTVIEGDMPIQFRWAFHGQELSSQMGISILKAGARVSILTIDSIAAGHSGDYTCTATNSADSANYTANLAVNGSPFENLIQFPPFKHLSPDSWALRPSLFINIHLNFAHVMRCFYSSAQDSAVSI